MSADSDPAALHPEISEQLSDFVDETLPTAARASVAQHLETCAECRADCEGLRALRNRLSGVARAPAPAEFGQQVAETIRRRSAGRFFAKRTLGDRVPFGVILIVALALLVAVAALLWSSDTGSLRRDSSEPRERGSGAVVPPP